MSKQRFDFLTQALVSSASLLQNSRALGRPTFQRGVVNLLDLLPLLRFHCSLLLLRFHAAARSAPAANLAPRFLARLSKPQPSLLPSNRRSSAVPQPDSFSDQKPPGSSMHRRG